MTLESLSKANVRRHRYALSAARRAIEQLCREGKPVNFVAVSRAAGVSRPWLYRQAELREDIDRLRSTTVTLPSLPIRQQASVSSLRQLLATARGEVARLRAENTALRDQLARQLGSRRVANE